MPASGELFLGLDIGTSATKAIVIDRAGDVRASASCGYPVSTPQPLWSEQNPEDWWRATVACIDELLTAGIDADQIAAVSFSGQMHGSVLLGSEGEVLRPAILWNDQRTAEECADIEARVGADRVLELTGNPVMTGFTAPKLLWVQKHEPDVYAGVRHVCLPKDYVRYRLTGQIGCDVSDASGTAYFEVRARRWCGEILEAIDAKMEWLGDAVESPTVVGTVQPGVCALPATTRVVAGAGDQAAQAVGSGVVEEGIVSATVGTSGVVFAASDDYRVDPAGRLHAFCHAVPGQWHLMGVMLSAAGSLSWYHDVVAGAGHDEYERLFAEAANVEPGCEGLTFLPYLSGERTPHADPYARGAFIGLTQRHTQPALTRAVLEGVGYGLLDSVELMRALGIEPDHIRISGGGARSSVWRQILADQFAVPLKTTNVPEAGAYGAAILAAVGAGAFESVPHACRELIRVTAQEKPGEATAYYADGHKRYQALYPALANLASS